MSDLIKIALDMDEWKHSWHNNLKTAPDFTKARETLLDKLERKQEQCRDLIVAIRSADYELSTLEKDND
jgi:hypothetical protein